MTRQTDNYHLSLAGEFYVAAELQRQGIHASVTYGNAKQTDVVAFNEGSSRAVVVEVKTTRQDSWIVGGHVPPPAERPWVFVHMPVTAADPPRFFILTQAELHEILAPIDQRYRANYLTRHGREFVGDGVVTLAVKAAGPHLAKWEKITALVNAV